MRVSRIYQQTELSKDQELSLDQRASHYLSHVLRCKIGQTIQLFNGKGDEYTAEIIEVSKKFVNVKVGQSIEVNRESPLKIHLIQGISRGEKMDYTLQKAVELGVTEITPVLTDRCDIKLTAERKQKRMQHWQGVIISACEQSGRNILPTLHPVCALKDINLEGLTLVLQPDAKQSCKDLTKAMVVNIIIGPEGGFSENELSMMQAFTAITLGPRVLRTETAALATVSMLQSLWGDFA